MTARILVVDDVPANARLLEAKLTAEYYQVATARDGFDALDRARAWQPDLVVLDVMMPGMDGFECCRRLKEDEATAHVPVVMVTALGEPAERIQGLEAGADDFLTKPVEYDTLVARVRGLVRLKRMFDEWRMRGRTARSLGLSEDRAGAPRIEGARALVVDDWDHGAETVRLALDRDGIGAARARGIAEARQVCAAQAFDLIVLSLSMATEDALLLASSLRADDATRDIPMLLLAETEHRARLLRGFDMGANDWLLLPLDENELRVRARNQIRRKFYQDRLRADLGQALELAATDPLTGLYNHRYLMRHLRGLLDAGQPGPIAVLMIDVDHFKAINDEHGHGVGDEVIRRVAEALVAGTGSPDLVGRYGGEEFCCVLPGACLEVARAAAERMRRTVAQPAFARVPLTVSFGVASIRSGAADLMALVDQADQALYAAKSRGRNRVEHWEAPRKSEPPLEGMPGGRGADKTIRRIDA
jgi:two-component system cell cycle response regulator